jgi:hypothetical protein
VRSSCCLCVCVSPLCLKSGIMEPKETAVARQQLDKPVAVATNTRNSKRTFGRGVSNTHYVRDGICRSGPPVWGSLESETVRCGHESCGSRPRE